MDRIDLHGIRPDNAKKILKIIADSDRISRADIARAADLSVMTVGKIVDVLIGSGLVTEIKPEVVGVGRPAGLLVLRRNVHALVLDLSEHGFRMSVTDAGLGICDSLKYTYNRRFYYDENLYAFLKTVRAYLDRRGDLSDMYGVGISVPGKYMSADDRVICPKMPELESVALKFTVEHAIGRSVTLVKTHTEAAALSYVSQIPDCCEQIVIYMFVGKTIDGVVCHFGNFLKGSRGHGSDLGILRTRFGQTLDERISACRNDLMIADEIYDTVYNLIAVFDPDVFIIESDTVREPELFIENISDTLHSVCRLPAERMPQFLTGTRGVRQSVRGTAMMLREKWIDSIL